MLLNVRQNGFVLSFPPDFFAPEIKEKYKQYFQSLILPYDTIEEFMSSTVQSINWPGWTMQTVAQTRLLGKQQEYKSSKQVVDQFSREFTITFKMTDTKERTFSPMRLSLLDNEGYLVSSIIFKNPILTSQDGFNLSYSTNTPDFKTFTAKFSYFTFDIELDFD